jgi:hydroxymethylglutaryl-CoA lyase
MKHFVVHEIGPRDGLQIEQQVVPIDIREGWIRRAMASGVDIVQAGSFVKSEKVPQMAGSDELFRRLQRDKSSSTVLSGLALNERGMEQAMECGVDMLCMGASASETHSRKNSGMGSMEALQCVIGSCREAMAASKKVQVSVQSAFGCGFDGHVPERRVLDMVRAYVEAGLLNISLADTSGYAHPAQVERMFSAILDFDPGIKCTCHFHDNYGLGMANIMAAMRVGVTSFETSFAGMGGCPFTKEPAGNVATEDFVNALQLQGKREDINLDCLIGLAADVARHFGREMPGSVYKTRLIPFVHRLLVEPDN